MIRAEIRQRARLETEVKIARDIQQSLLPATELRLPWCSLAGAAVPATEVGGDFYDIIRLSDDEIVVAIADVTGHGVGAGILGAMTKSALRSELVHTTDPLSVLTTVNSTLLALSDQKTFVTFGYARIDRRTMKIQYATAGHPPLFLHRSRARAVDELRTVNLALGLRKDLVFATGEAAFEPGDALLLYTDGILEAANSRGEQFGSERLRQGVLSEHADPAALCSGLLRSLSAFAGQSSFQDDVSLLCVHFTS